MLPQLQAQESLQASAAVAAGTGWLKPMNHRRVMADLNRLARGKQQARKLTGNIREAALASMGIKVVKKMKHG